MKVDETTGTLIRDGVPSILNPFDELAVEAAVQLKEKYGGEVTLITMGPPQAKEALLKALAMGGDKAVHMTDRAFAGADTWVTALTLAEQIKKMEFDIVICGKQAIDGDTAQVGPGVATQLGIPQLTYVSKVREIDLENKRIVVERMLEDGKEIAESSLPALLTVVKDINEPRLPSLLGIKKAAKAEISTLTASDLAVDKSKCGLEGSPTEVVRVFTPEPRGGGEVLEGELNETIPLLAEKLMEAKVIK